MFNSKMVKTRYQALFLTIKVNPVGLYDQLSGDS